MNPQAIERGWVAENSVRLLKQSGSHRLYEQGYLISTQAREEYARFLETQQLTDELIRDSLLLAKLDVFLRVGKIDENLQDVDEKDVEDLRRLISLVDANLFKSSGVVALNPTFGLASHRIGGADADLLIDDLLIDIKTKKRVDFRTG
jgi:hypothetical protein